MTDKQIIIDGVDVSGCDELINECDCYLTQEHDYRSETPYTYNKCSGFPNCYYKQLKRKEQECERWKSNFYGKVSAIEELLQQLDQLKAENEDLKKQLMQKSDIDMFFSTPIEGWSNDSCGICKYKNCLTEIKEIASKVLLNTHDLEQFEDADALFGALLEIHKKISEVEDV